MDPTRARPLADRLRRAEIELSDAAGALTDLLEECDVASSARAPWARRRPGVDTMASAYVGAAPATGNRLRRRVRAIDEALADARSQARATDDDLRGEVAGLDDAEAEAAAHAVATAFASVRDEERRLALAGAVQPLRDRLLAELGDAGRALYVGGGPDHGEVDRITRLLDAIAFRPIPPHESKAVAFLDGLLLGDAHPHRYRSSPAVCSPDVARAGLLDHIVAVLAGD